MCLLLNVACERATCVGKPNHARDHDENVNNLLCERLCGEIAVTDGRDSRNCEIEAGQIQVGGVHIGQSTLLRQVLLRDPGLVDIAHLCSNDPDAGDDMRDQSKSHEEPEVPAELLANLKLVLQPSNYLHCRALVQLG